MFKGKRDKCDNIVLISFFMLVMINMADSLTPTEVVENVKSFVYMMPNNH